jgi:hypothetical protein
MCFEWGRRDTHTEFYPENFKGRDHFGDADIDRRIILKSIPNKYGIRVWTEFNWLRTVFSGGLL